LINNLYEKIRISWFYGVNKALTSQTSLLSIYAKIELMERLKDKVRLERFGYKVYSQNDEDSILAEIFKRVETMDKKFAEFGVQNSLKCKSHFLLHKGWQGLWLNASPAYGKQICDKFKTALRHYVTVTEAINAF